MRGASAMIRFAMLGALLLAGCAGAPPPAPAAGQTSATAIRMAAWQLPPDRGDNRALNAFFYDLAALRAGRITHLRILQIGDSHTAGDYMTGDLRDALQARYGNGGIGTRAAGLPYIGVRQKDMTISEAGLWRYHDSLTDHAFTDYGLSGFTAVSRSAGANLSLAVTDPRGFDKGFVDVATGSGGGNLQILVDGAVVKTLSTFGPDGVFVHAAFKAPAPGAHRLTLVAQRAGIKILDWNTERNDPGLIFDSFGVVGATAGIAGYWNPEIMRRQLAVLRPALVIVAYGTNEGAESDFDPAAYAATFGKLLYDIHHWSPASSVLVISPTDGSRQSRDCLASGALDCPWLTLPALDAVRQVQSEEAARHVAALWNAAGPELATGGMNGWVQLSPALGRGDHLHFTAAGYAILAEALDRWLTARFETYLAAHDGAGHS
jgi:lysophospholipase L1-like esterase